jgi:hypothetical protein
MRPWRKKFHQPKQPGSHSNSPTASEELISALMARMLPDISHLIVSSVLGQVQSLPPPVDDDSSASTDTHTTSTTAPAISRSHEVALMAL